MPCAAGTEYNDDIQTCDHIHRNTATNTVNAETGQNTDDNTQTGGGATSAGAQDNLGGSNGYDCMTNSPCSPLLTAGVYHYAYQGDASSFVQCDAWGGCWVMPCAPGTVFNAAIQTCVHAPAGRSANVGNGENGDGTGGNTDAGAGNMGNTPTSGNAGDVTGSDLNVGGYDCNGNNPCSPLVEPNIYHYPYQEPSHFVQCNEWGGCWVMPCAPGTHQLEAPNETPCEIVKIT